MREPQLSKSERKRDAKRLQALGLKLAGLNHRQLDRVPLTKELTQALEEYHRITSNEAKRRQLQFIGKLMRTADTPGIEQALGLIEGKSARAKYQMHQLEAWRDRLLAEDSALTEYLHAHPTIDRQLLRHHINRARAANGTQDQRTAARILFRYLRDNAEAPVGHSD